MAGGPGEAGFVDVLDEGMRDVEEAMPLLEFGDFHHVTRVLRQVAHVLGRCGELGQHKACFVVFFIENFI